MNKRKMYIVISAILIVVFIILVSVGISRCGKEETSQKRDNIPQEKQDDKDDNDLDINLEDNQLIVEESENAESDTGKFIDWFEDETTEDANENESGNNQTEDSDKEKDEPSLSSGNTDEHSDKKWSQWF